MEIKNKKIKIISLFIFTNLCTYMLSSSQEIHYIDNSIKDIVRPNYITLKVKASLKTELTLGAPMTFTNTKRSLYIPYVFILEQFRNDSQFSELTQASEQTYFLVSIHKKHLKQILNNERLEILPQLPKEVVLNQFNKRTLNYEITL